MIIEIKTAIIEANEEINKRARIKQIRNLFFWCLFAIGIFILGDMISMWDQVIDAFD